MVGYVAHLLIFAPLINPLEHIFTKVNNTVAEGWAKRGSASFATAVGPLLRKMVWINRQPRTYLSVSQISWVDNKESDAVS